MKNVLIFFINIIILLFYNILTILIIEFSLCEIIPDKN